MLRDFSPIFNSNRFAVFLLNTIDIMKSKSEFVCFKLLYTIITKIYIRARISTLQTNFSEKRELGQQFNTKT